VRLVETALAIDTVETAHLTIGWQEIDAERNAQTTTVNWPEYGRWINNCTHNGCKITLFFCDKEKK
jgi:hypothetical protein